jgi:GDP-mannose 6-dehydrogenase
VAFGNEVGRLCKSLDIDSHDVMNIFVQDTKLNLSPYYLKPGFAFGGSCLPKEVRAVVHLAEERDVDVPLFRSLTETNESHIEQAVKLLEPFAGKRIGFLGVTFKADTDDLRESPTVELMAMLAAKGEKLSVYDGNLTFGPHLKGQIDYIKHARPSLAAMIDHLEDMSVGDADTLIANSDVVVVSHATHEFRAAVRARAKHVHVLDLVRLFKELPDDDNYQGIGW